MNTGISTRILPGLKAEYDIVSLPCWAWYWIDLHVEYCYANGYSDFVNHNRALLSDTVDLATFMSVLAMDLRDTQLRAHHNLANDNDFYNNIEKLAGDDEDKRNYPKAFQFPTIFQVFKFLPHATDMATLWQRQNYHKHFSE